MRPRYLLVALAGSDPALAGRIERRMQAKDLRSVLRTPRLLAFVNGGCNALPVGDAGIVVGTLFPRHGPAEAVTSLAEADQRAIAQDFPRRLLDRFWGGYVAALDGSEAAVMRDPSAALPCYAAQTRACSAFASDAELLIESGIADGGIDWDGLAGHLQRSGLPTPLTALTGIGELLAGFVLRLPGRMDRQQPCWSPWDHAGATDMDAPVMAERLARTIRHCVHAWSRAHGRLLASVSGGLDSSIVAAALAGCGADAICLTMYGEDASGDERLYARALCDHLGLPLVERPYDLDRIDICQALGAHLPRPSDRTHALSYEQAHLDVAAEAGAAAFVTGNGGDSLFGYSQSAAAAADRFLAQGLGAGVAATLGDVSRQTGCGLLRAATAALRIMRRPPAYVWRREALFLDGDILGLDPVTLDHPWLHAPPGALPGKAAHIASILRVQQCLEPSRSSVLPVINPLLSQPALELCLAVPSWEWRSGGRDRSLARRAFEKSLPPAIVQRRVKGGPDGFAARVLDRFRAQIRERLLDGHLARQRIIDTAAIEHELAQDRSSAGEQRSRLLELVAAEAWIDRWVERSQGPERRRSAAPA